MDNYPLITITALAVTVVIEYISVFHNFSKRIPIKNFFSLTLEEDKQERNAWMFLALIETGIVFCLFFFFLKLPSGLAGFLAIFIYIVISGLVLEWVEASKRIQQFLEIFGEKEVPE